MTKTCVICGKEFEARSVRGKYCSMDCAKNGEARRAAAWRAQNYTPTVRTCKICGTAFSPASSTQKYCGPPCAKAADRRRGSNRYPTVKRWDNNCSLDLRLQRYEPLGLTYGYGVASDHPEWSRVQI